jgi:hypothetical protein
MPQGPNVKRLIAHRMSLPLIPAGTPSPLQAGLSALAKPGNITAVAREATEWRSSSTNNATLRRIHAKLFFTIGDRQRMAVEVVPGLPAVGGLGRGRREWRPCRVKVSCVPRSSASP